MKKEEERDPMKWTKEAQAELDAAVASTPAGHPDAAKLKGGNDTPRTDIAIFQTSQWDKQVNANFARELERELTTALEQLNSANAQIVALRGALSFYADVSKYPAPLTGGMGDLWQDCGQIATKALSSPAPAVVPSSQLEEAVAVTNEFGDALERLAEAAGIQAKASELVDQVISKFISSPSQLTELRADAEVLLGTLGESLIYWAPFSEDAAKRKNEAMEIVKNFIAKHPAKGGADE